MEVLLFLEKFLDRVSPRVKGWEKAYAVDIRVSWDTLSEASTAKMCRDCDNRNVFSPCKTPLFLQDVCMAVYTKEKIAKSKSAALELLVKVGSGHCYYYYFFHYHLRTARKLNCDVH